MYFILYFDFHNKTKKMKKTCLIVLLAIICFAGKSVAQTGEPCGTTIMYNRAKQLDPKINDYEKLQEEIIANYVRYGKKGFGAAKTTTTLSDTDYYDIPVVVHVLHNYGSEVLQDNQIYNLIAEMNRFYSLKNDTSSVVKEFKKYVGNARMRFHLANIDPAGNPTNGITRHRTYLTYGYDDQAKLDQWSPASYFNIWFENYIGLAVTGGTVLAYSTIPPGAVGTPYYDGVICGAPYINDGGADGGSTLDHETGHFFNLYHPWNSSGKGCGEACGDDEVDDTPPTKGHYSTCNVNDSACATNYFVIYPGATADSFVNYPDTANTQNVMDYSGNCTNMFTKGQVARMHATLNSDVASRNSLWSSVNLTNTGVLAARKDLKPIPEFSAFPATGISGGTTKANYMDRLSYFTFPGVNLRFINETWNDTVTSINWTFSNSATVPAFTSTNPTINSTYILNSFADPGWVSLTMKATGNNSGDTSVTWPKAVFVADAVGTPGLGYFQEFSGADTAKWPMFNYYNNNLHWQFAHVGYDDTNSVEYVGYDERPVFVNGNPLGDLDDLFSVPFDLSSGVFGSGPCSMNFYYSGASRSSMGLDINDQLEISYSTNKSVTWTVLNTMTKNTLENMGATAFSYTPFNQSDWALFSVNLPAAARTPYTVFRFRYKPSVKVGYDGTLKTGTISSSNNFYMDRLTFSPWPAGIDNIKMGNIDVAVLPNPTNGDAYVVIKDAAYGSAQISVTDITGKVVYSTTELLSGNEARVLIPHASLSVSGMYLVHVVTGNQSRTQKLIVE